VIRLRGKEQKGNKNLWCIIKYLFDTIYNDVLQNVIHYRVFAWIIIAFSRVKRQWYLPMSHVMPNWLGYLGPLILIKVVFGLEERNKINKNKRKIILKKEIEYK